MQIAENVAVVGSMDSPVVRILKKKEYEDTEIFSYNNEYEHDEARLSADEKTVMLFSYDQFRIYDINGELLNETDIPNAEQVYDQQYVRDNSGSRLEVTYNDGTVRSYDGNSGELLQEEKTDAPDPELYEEFFTDNFKIKSDLHGTPSVYDKNTGAYVTELEKDAYLTYVTQVGRYIITQYTTTEGYNYGLLLNEKCETLAELPYLCDIIGESLFFDYPSGNLRKTRIYDINELVDTARDLQKQQEEIRK